MGKARVLVVDDSAFMRKAISLMLESDPEIEVVGMASNGEDGIELNQKLKPDVITLDIEMPRMDGLTALKRIMSENPTRS
jgi:two-component system chemotaxis response regulator CheB